MTELPPVKIWVGQACTNVCRFCIQGSKQFQVGAEVPYKLPLPTSLDEGKGRRVEILGGEPGLWAEEICSWLLRLDGQGQLAGGRIQTNGSGWLAAESFRGLAKLKGLWFELSLQGPRADIHDYHTGVMGSFERAVEFARAVREQGNHLAMSMVITKSNYRHLSESVQFAKSLGAEELQLCLVEPKGRAEMPVPPLRVSQALLRPYWQGAERWAKRLRIGLFLRGPGQREVLGRGALPGFPRAELPQAPGIWPASRP